MTSKTHNLIAFAGLLTAAAYTPVTGLNGATIIGTMIGSIIGSLLPDLDQAGNRLWGLLPGGNLMGKVLRNLFISHRGISHSLLGVFGFYVFLRWLILELFNPEFVDPMIIFYSIMIGYLSHLGADGLTEAGLPLLFPSKLKFGFPPIRSWRIKTGRWFEKYVIFPGVIIYIGAILVINWETLTKMM